VGKEKTRSQRLKEADEAELYDENGNIIARGNIQMSFNTGKKPNKFFKKGDFFTMSRLFAGMMKTKRDYNNLTFRLLFELMERIDYNNRIQTFRQSELATELDAQQPHISVALKMLETDNIIKKEGHDYYFTEEFIRYASDLKR
jgi:predicted XRE-type DNA-binding protein